MAGAIDSCAGESSVVTAMPEHSHLYVAARRVLLDALEALSSQLPAIIVVGAQAVYLRTGDAGLTMAPYTTDADLALSPDDLVDIPRLEDAMRKAQFEPDDHQPGTWTKAVEVDDKSEDIPVDLLVPAALGGGGRRAARIPPHDRMAARKSPGLEAALVDNDLMDVGALEAVDSRRFSVRVAGPAGLLVAKLHKLHDRILEARMDRISEKDAADMYRIIQGIPIREVIARWRVALDDRVAAEPSREALAYLADLFGAPRSEGVRLASDALRIDLPAERVQSLCVSFVHEVRAELDGD